MVWDGESRYKPLQFDYEWHENLTEPPNNKILRSWQCKITNNSSVPVSGVSVIIALCVHYTCFDLHCGFVSAGLSLTVSYSQGEAVLSLHKVCEKQHRLVVRVVQHILWEKRTDCDCEECLSCPNTGTWASKQIVPDIQVKYFR